MKEYNVLSLAGLTTVTAGTLCLGELSLSANLYTLGGFLVVTGAMNVTVIYHQIHMRIEAHKAKRKVSPVAKRVWEG